MEEIWEICFYNGEIFDNYEVSNLGNVRSLNYNKTGQIKILKQIESGNGYLYVDLCKDKKVKQCRIHILVANAFIPNDNPTIKTEIHHINHNKHDNRVENLMWIDRKTHNLDEEVMEQRKQTKHKKVRCIETNTVYDSILQASEETGIHKGNIVQVCKGKRKSCGGFTWEYVD